MIRKNNKLHNRKKSKAIRILRNGKYKFLYSSNDFHALNNKQLLKKSKEMGIDINEETLIFLKKRMKLFRKNQGMIILSTSEDDINILDGTEVVTFIRNNIRFAIVKDAIFVMKESTDGHRKNLDYYIKSQFQRKIIDVSTENSMPHKNNVDLLSNRMRKYASRIEKSRKK